MAVGFPTKANWVSGDILTASQMDDLAGTLNTVPALITASGSTNVAGKNGILNSNFNVWQRYVPQVTGTITAATSGATTAYTVTNTFVVGQYVTVTGMTPTTLNAAGVVTVASGTAFTISATTSGTFSAGGIATGSPYISFAASTAYTAGYNTDRWQTYTGANQAITISRQPTSDTTNLPFIQYCMRYQRNSGQTGTASIGNWQQFETINSIPYAGKTVTYSFYARAGANFSAASNALGFYVTTGTGTDQNSILGFTGGTNTINSSATLTTTWQRFSATATIPTSTTQVSVCLNYAPVGTAGANDYFEVTGVQLEIASTATAYSPNGATQQAELAACQRYYQRITSSAVNGFLSGVLTATATTNVQGLFASKSTMRVIPTVCDYATVSVTPDNITTGLLASSVTSSTNTQTGDNIILNFAVTGATQYRPYVAYASTAGGYIGLGAEL